MFNMFGMIEAMYHLWVIFHQISIKCRRICWWRLNTAELKPSKRRQDCNWTALDPESIVCRKLKICRKEEPPDKSTPTEGQGCARKSWEFQMRTAPSESSSNRVPFPWNQYLSCLNNIQNTCINGESHHQEERDSHSSQNSWTVVPRYSNGHQQTHQNRKNDKDG